MIGLVDLHNRWLKDKREHEERDRLARAVEAAKLAEHLANGHAAVTANGIHAAHQAAEQHRHIQLADSVVYCETCIEPMRPGIAHYCREAS